MSQPCTKETEIKQLVDNTNEILILLKGNPMDKTDNGWGGWKTWVNKELASYKKTRFRIIYTFAGAMAAMSIVIWYFNSHAEELAKANQIVLEDKIQSAVESGMKKFIKSDDLKEEVINIVESTNFNPVRQ